MVCEIPFWGPTFAAQTVLVYFVCTEFSVPRPNSIAIEFVPSATALHPSMQSIYGGTIVYIEGSGFDRNTPEFKCVFLQGTFSAMTAFSVTNPGSGFCPTPFWTAVNLANRTYEVLLVYGHQAIEIHVGLIKLE
jgi:hypothetical protein